MASALEQLTQNYGTDSPVSFEDYYKSWMKDNRPGAGITDPYNIGSRIGNFFTGNVNSAKQSYEQYLTGYQNFRNSLASAKANQETWQREDSQIQRLMEDYRKAGLNPFALLSGGNLSGGVVSSQAQRPDYKRSSSKDDLKNESKLMSTAIKVLALVLLKKAF